MIKNSFSSLSRNHFTATQVLKRSIFPLLLEMKEARGRSYVLTAMALSVCVTTWRMWKKGQQKRAALPPLVSLTRAQVAKYWLDGMFWKAILVAAGEAQEKWGSSIFRIRGAGFFDPPSIYCTDSAYVEKVLGAQGLQKSDESYVFLKDPFGQGQNCMITRKMHERYNEIRKPIMNFFSLSNIGKRLDCCRSKMEEFVKLWDDAAENQKTIEICHAICELTMDLLGIACFDYDFQALSGADNPGVRMMHAVPFLMEECGNKQRFMPLRKYMTFLPDVKKAKQVMKGNLQFCKDLLQHRREELQEIEQTSPNGKRKAQGELLLDTFFQSPYESDDTRAADVVLFLIAGHETTGYQLAWCVYSLIQHPECLRKAQDEVDRVLGDERIAGPGMLKDLRYTMACFLESLRVWPVVPEGSGRTVTKPLNIEGYEIPLGCQITISNIGANRSWGCRHSDANFSPERWLDQSQKAQELRKSFTGFSYGPRSCVGRTLAEQEPC